MSFTRTASALTLHRLATWQILSETPQRVSSGWDSTRITYAAMRSTSSANAILAEWPLGRSLPAGLNGQMYLVEAAPRAMGGGIWAVDVVGQGLLANRPPRTTGGAATLQRSMENLLINGRLYPKAEVWESTPTFEVEFIASSPETNLVGTALNPSNAPFVRQSEWTWLADPTYHYPNGWVLADLRYEQLLNLSLYLITATYEYRYAITP
jgi:hypothetical protein